MPEISVVVPIFNGEQFVDSVFETLLNQTFEDFEVIIVDDGSTDGTLNKINEQKKFHHDLKVRVIASEHRGLSASRNQGLAAASADYIAFLDCDDIWYPEKLNVQLKLLKVHSAVAVFSRVEYFDGEKITLNLHANAIGHTSSPQRLLNGQFVVFGGGSNILCTRDALWKVGDFDESLPFAEDFDMWLRLSEIGPILEISSCHVRISVRQDSMQRSRHYMVQRGLLRSRVKIYRKWYPFLDVETFDFLVNQLVDTLIHQIRSRNLIQILMLTPIWLTLLFEVLEKGPIRLLSIPKCSAKVLSAIISNILTRIAPHFTRFRKN